ncbi:hypothetical protein [Thermomonas fusca]|uniref:Uncharacterized protein n=1 Tax=Thermomonas fusca TaxID=215690 RepID=A0A5R9PJA1_9GAMM|nr:hypothetical protein [Thermomonas fusca]TLX22690.1 hypothetical protein E5S66_01270 [Thermomonas fusca]
MAIRTPLVIAFLVLCACAPVSRPARPAQHPVSEISVVTSSNASSSVHAPIRPRISVEQAWLGLRELIRNSSSTRDITLKRVEEALRVEFTKEGDDYVFQERISPGWSHHLSIAAHQDGSISELEYSLDAEDITQYSNAQPVCIIDVDRISADLRAMGFGSVRVESKQQSGTVFGYDFFREGMTISIGSQDESGDPEGNSGRACLRNLTIS